MTALSGSRICARSMSPPSFTSISGTDPPSFPDKSVVPTGAQHRRADRQRIPGLNVPDVRPVRFYPSLYITGESDHPCAPFTSWILVMDQKSVSRLIRDIGYMGIEITVGSPLREFACVPFS